MGSVGDAYDNAMGESFFATLERALPARRKFQTKAEAPMAVFAFTEGCCNPGRRHSALGYQSPVNLEIQAQNRLLNEGPQLSTKSMELQRVTLEMPSTRAGCLSHGACNED